MARKSRRVSHTVGKENLTDQILNLPASVLSAPSPSQIARKFNGLCTGYGECLDCSTMSWVLNQSRNQQSSPMAWNPLFRCACRYYAAEFWVRHRSDAGMVQKQQPIASLLRQSLVTQTAESECAFALSQLSCNILRRFLKWAFLHPNYVLYLGTWIDPRLLR